MQQGAALAFTHAAAPLAASLTLLNNAAADTATDYKALVCVFLYGANDHYGTVVPHIISASIRRKVPRKTAT